MFLNQGIFGLEILELVKQGARGDRLRCGSFRSLRASPRDLSRYLTVVALICLKCPNQVVLALISPIKRQQS